MILCLQASANLEKRIENCVMTPLNSPPQEEQARRAAGEDRTYDG